MVDNHKIFLELELLLTHTTEVEDQTLALMVFPVAYPSVLSTSTHLYHSKQRLMRKENLSRSLSSICTSLLMDADSSAAKKREMKITDIQMTDIIHPADLPGKDFWLNRQKKLQTSSLQRLHHTFIPTTVQTTDHLLQSTMMPTKHLQVTSTKSLLQYTTATTTMLHNGFHPLHNLTTTHTTHLHHSPTTSLLHHNNAQLNLASLRKLL